jgi:hypothetical protein
MIEAYDPVWLADAALYWNRAADHLQDTFAQVHAQAQGFDWQGASGEALTAHTFGMHTDAISAANQMRGAAAIAREGASNLSALASKVRYAIEDAQANGFAVGEDLSVTDTRLSRNRAERAARRAQAETHARDIMRAATALWTHDMAVGSDMTNATAGIQTVDNTIHTHPHDDPFSEHIEAPPYKAPAGKEWHWYTGGKGWQLEDPLEHCDGHHVFRDMTGAILGILLAPAATIAGGPLGFLGAMGGAATAIDELGQCAAP